MSRAGQSSVAGQGGEGGSAGMGGEGGVAGCPCDGGAAGDVPAQAGSAGAPPVPPEVAAWEPCPKYSSIAVVAANTEQGCWVGCSNGEVFYGGCDGTSWLRNDEPAEPATSAPLPELSVSTIVPLYGDPLRAYVSFVGSPSVHRIWETQTQGQVWFEHSDSSVLDVWSLSYIPFATDHLYAYVLAPDGSDSYIDASSDAGSTYSEMYNADGLLALPSGNTDLISTIAMYDYSPDHFVVGTIRGHLYVTSNGTAEEPSWGRIGLVEMPTRTVTKIALRPRESSYELWVTYEGPLGYGVWVSRDNGMTWNNACAPGSGLPDGDGSAVMDGWYGVSYNPVFVDTLYLFGTEGAYRTDNGGLSWTRTWPPGK